MAEKAVDQQELDELNDFIAELYSHIGQNWKDIGRLDLTKSEVLGIKHNIATLLESLREATLKRDDLLTPDADT